MKHDLTGSDQGVIREKYRERRLRSEYGGGQRLSSNRY